MRRLVMTVPVVQAGKCTPAFIALETDRCRGRGLDGRTRGGRKWRRVWVMEDSRYGRRRRGNVLDLMMRLTVMVLLALLPLLALVLVRRVGLQGWRLLVTS